MNKTIYIKQKYLYIALGSSATLAVLAIFLMVHSQSQAQNQPSASQVLSTQTSSPPTGGAPPLIEKTLGSHPGGASTKKGITKIQPVTIAHTVKEGDSLASIATQYQADAQTIADFPGNKIPDDFSLKLGQVVIVPAGVIGNTKIKDLLPQGSGFLSWPIKGTITQYAFAWHAGSIDITLHTGDPIRAAKDGVVSQVNNFTTGYGKHIIIDHGEGYSAIYAHLSKIQVSPGQRVSKGELIGLGGSTGRSTGPHLHFEVTQHGQHIDPMTLLN